MRASTRLLTINCVGRVPDRRVFRKTEPRWHYAHDRQDLVESANGLSDGIGRAREMALPVCVTDQDRGAASGLLLVVVEQTADQRLHSHHAEELAGDLGDLRIFGGLLRK